MPVTVEEAGVAGHEVAVGIDRLGGRQAACKNLEQHRPLDRPESRRCRRSSPPRRRGRHADRIKLDLAIGLQADVGTGFGLAVELLQVDADRAVETKQIGTNGGTGGVGDTDATHAEYVLQRPIDEEIAQRIEQPVGRRHRVCRRECRHRSGGRRP